MWFINENLHSEIQKHFVLLDLDETKGKLIIYIQVEQKFRKRSSYIF